MIHGRQTIRRWAAGTAYLAAALSFTGASAQVAQHYTLTDLTSNLASLAPTRDANLVNPWGLSRSTKGAWWVSDNGTGLSTLYDGTGKTESLVVKVPGASGNATGTPTGTVFNGDSTAFQIAPGKASAFLFVTEDGTISGWSPAVNLTSAVVMVTNPNAVYKGATLMSLQTATGPQTFLFVANFRSGKVEVYDSNFKPAAISPVAYNTVHVHGYAPFNVQNIGGNLYVAYAKQDSAKHDEVDGTALGFVEVYSPLGYKMMSLQRGEWFNAPWGLAQAPGDFGQYSHDILVGQFGSGQILAFDTLTGVYKGTLNAPDNTPLAIDGLWALSFGADSPLNGNATTLYFAAGPGKEVNGVFGSITAVENIKGNGL